jgi:hypothetical protein
MMPTADAKNEENNHLLETSRRFKGDDVRPRAEKNETSCSLVLYVFEADGGATTLAER